MRKTDVSNLSQIDSTTEGNVYPKVVSFTEMKQGTREDFELIKANDRETARSLPDKIINHLQLLDEDDGAYQISRLKHCLQTATRAERDGADEDWVVAALLHDIGDVLAPFSHAEVSYEILKPFVREEVAWTVRHHGIFQMKYNKSLDRSLRDKRDQFKEHPFYESALKFVEQWDQMSFDPEYDTLPLSHFESYVRDVFSRKAR